MMLKIYTLLISLCLPFLSYGQLIDEIPQDENGNMYFSEVVQVDGASQSSLYQKSKQLFVDMFKSAKDVIQMDEKDVGIVVGKGFVEIPVTRLVVPNAVQTWFTIKIQSREGRYKYEIYDINYGSYETTDLVSPDRYLTKEKYYNSNGKPRNMNEQYKTNTLAAMEALKEHIKAGMNKKDEW